MKSLLLKKVMIFNLVLPWSKLKIKVSNQTLCFSINIPNIVLVLNVGKQNPVKLGSNFNLFSALGKVFELQNYLK